MFSTSDNFRFEFSTYHPDTRLPHDADEGTIVVTLVADGIDTDEESTVTRVSAGRYKVRVGLSEREVGEVCYVTVYAEVNGVPGRQSTAPFVITDLAQAVSEAAADVVLVKTRLYSFERDTETGELLVSVRKFDPDSEDVGVIRARNAASPTDVEGLLASLSSTKRVTLQQKVTK